MSDIKALPQYRSHKIVGALRIQEILVHDDYAATIIPADEGFDTFVTEEGWANRYRGNSEDLGVYVVYEDGFTSWSPTKAFDEGYTRLEA